MYVDSNIMSYNTCLVSVVSSEVYMFTGSHASISIQWVIVHSLKYEWIRTQVFTVPMHMHR